MPVKVSFILAQTAAGNKTGGWSETWYFTGSETEIGAACQTWMTRRSAMLTPRCFIQGFRIQNVGGKGQFFTASVPGTFAADSDIPQMALNCRCQGSGTNNVKFFQLRGIPDGQVVDGAYQGNLNFPQNVSQFFTHLVNFGWRFRAIDLTKVKVNILSIDALGAFKIAAGTTFAAGGYMDLLRCRGVDGSKLSGRYYIDSKTSDQIGVFLNWPGTVVKEKGQARPFALDYPLIQANSVKIYNVTTRKVGRPFFLYRGRQTAR